MLRAVQWIGQHAKTITSVLVLGSMLVSGIVYAWPKIGWYAQETVDTHHNNIVDKIDDVGQKIDDLLIEWRCSEWTEELSQLLDKETLTGAEQVREQTLRENLRENNCERYDT